ncbi:MAG: DNA replication and repair protein RecF, partial [Candidatus Latescibacterota bacterium]
MGDVFLEALELRNFRNYARAEFAFGARGALIVGANGSGKSNLLEAISFLALGKSLRGASDWEAVRDGEDGFGIYAKLSGE